MRSIKFNDKYSYGDWGLILNQFLMSEPNPKEMYIDVPGGDSSIDLTEYLTGDIAYEDREFSATFGITHPGETMDEITAVRSYIHGKKMRIELPDDPAYYYTGRCKVSTSKSYPFVYLEVTARCEPWKYKKLPTIYNITIDSAGTKSIVCKNSRKRVIPTITADGEITVDFGGNSYTLNAGTHRITNIVFVEGDNKITFSGNDGTKLSVEYSEGAI
jgi:phage-related protein